MSTPILAQAQAPATIERIKKARLAYIDGLSSNLFATRESGQIAYSNLLDKITLITNTTIKQAVMIDLHIFMNTISADLTKIEKGE